MEDTTSDDQTAPAGDTGGDEATAEPDTVEYWRSRARSNEKRAKANAEAARTLPGVIAERDELAAELAELRARVAEREEAELRAEIVAARHLPADIADRLQGETREELEADADRLAEALRPRDLRPREALRRVNLDSIDPDANADKIAQEWTNQAFRRG